MAKATIKDVAVKAGVTEQTVSEFIKSQASVRPETGSRIREAMKELNYTDPTSPLTTD